MVEALTNVQRRDGSVKVDGGLPQQVSHVFAACGDSRRGQQTGLATGRSPHDGKAASTCWLQQGCSREHFRVDYMIPVGRRLMQREMPMCGQPIYARCQGCPTPSCGAVRATAMAKMELARPVLAYPSPRDRVRLRPAPPLGAGRPRRFEETPD